MIPSDPIILLSYVNTKLRDRDKDLATFCRKEETDQDALCRKLLKSVTLTTPLATSSSEQTKR